jgi:hypothetical protein
VEINDHTGGLLDAQRGAPMLMAPAGEEPDAMNAPMADLGYEISFGLDQFLASNEDPWSVYNMRQAA